MVSRSNRPSSGSWVGWPWEDSHIMDRQSCGLAHNVSKSIDICRESMPPNQLVPVHMIELFQPLYQMEMNGTVDDIEAAIREAISASTKLREKENIEAKRDKEIKQAEIEEAEKTVSYMDQVKKALMTLRDQNGSSQREIIEALKIPPNKVHFVKEALKQGVNNNILTKTASRYRIKLARKVRRKAPLNIPKVKSKRRKTKRKKKALTK